MIPLTRMNFRLLLLPVCLSFLIPLPAVAQDPERPALFLTPLSLGEMTEKQAVLETDLGTITVDLLPDFAPNHVGLFMELAAAGEYDGTTFHRVVRHGIIQGGDPLTKDSEQVARYGQGGLEQVGDELSGEPHTRGAVAGIVVPGRPDSGGSQFFISVIDQPALDGQYTIWGRVAEGMDVVTAISETHVDQDGRATERVVLRRVTIRDTPPLEPLSFSTETAEALAAYGAVIETDLGSITVGLYPDRAPFHVRNFLRLAEAGVYDGMSFHRVVPGFVIQTGYVPSRRDPLTERQQRLVRTLEPEFNDTRHVRGILSMARGEDLASASTSFFICTDVATELDDQYTAFGVVVDGKDVVSSIESVATDGERPVDRVEVRTIRVFRR
jgi:cyclophilin family peptidyl-prolyl cis-trans isomerase